MLITGFQTATHALCWLSVNRSMTALRLKPRERDKGARQKWWTGLHHWQVTCDAKSDEH